MTEISRISFLNDKKENAKGDYILYMMQASQRLNYNPALSYAAEIAKKKKLPLVIGFAVMANFPQANERSYIFMLQGLKELSKKLSTLRIPFVCKISSYEKLCENLSRKAVLTVTDKGYLKFQRAIRKTVSKKLKIPFIEVESDTIVPLNEASNKLEPYAMTLRRKLQKKLNFYLKRESKFSFKNDKKPSFKNILDLSDENAVIKKLKVKDAVKDVSLFFKGGEKEAQKKLSVFLKTGIKNYHLRSHPEKDYSSGLSPYLHFGQISPIETLLKVKKTRAPFENILNFTDQITTWRELARNFVYHNDNYDNIEGLPNWALTELKKHSSDYRKYSYGKKEFEKALTHDPYWNAAQKELLLTGKIHNYMRMYWGKKILEWSSDYKKAFETMVYLNDKYALDGRDPNGYASIAWCMGRHDRPFFERPITGKIRYMSAKGLERKFEIETYLKKINSIENLIIKTQKA